MQFDLVLAVRAVGDLAGAALQRALPVQPPAVVTALGVLFDLHGIPNTGVADPGAACRVASKFKCIPKT